MIASERETTITSVDDDDLIHIWSAQARFISRMRKHPLFRETSTRSVDGTETASFVIDADLWNPVTGAKRASGMTSEQKKASAERLAAARAVKSGMFPVAAE